KLRGIFDRKEVCYFQIRSLTPQPAKHCRQAEPAGNALVFAVQPVGLDSLALVILLDIIRIYWL
ncbi:MAG: hypothetical protein KAV83_03030, partial [Desulfobacterales bacterium]|nr:hypothetical protein [Desulfobacterales bacterium]